MMDDNDQESDAATMPAILRNPDGTYPKGVSGNPQGRPLHARRKLSEAFLRDMIASWEANGPEAIRTLLDEHPRDYVRLVASLLPKHFEFKVNEYDELTDEQLDRRIATLHAVIEAARAGAGGTGDGAGSAEQAQPALLLPALPQAG
jgi:hypothetical protein